MNPILTGITAIVLYGLATINMSLHIYRGSPQQRHLFLSLGLLAMLFHGITVNSLIFHPEGVDLGLFPMLALIGWLVAILSMAGALHRPVDWLSMAAFPLAILTLVIGILPGDSYTPKHDLPRAMVSHILVSILAYSVIAFAFVHAILLAIQNRHIKAGRLTGITRLLPPMQTMEAMLFELLWVGFLLLTVAIVSGFWFMEDMFAQKVAHKTILSIVAWGVFAILLSGRHFLGWRGQTAVRWTYAGFLLLGLAFLGSKLVLELILHRS